MQSVGPPACWHALALINLALWLNSRTNGSRKPWKATHLGKGNTPKSNRVDKTRKVWLTAYLEERYIDSKISDPPGWGFSARPTISPSKKKYTITETLTNRNINFDPVKRVSSTTRRMTHCSESNQEATMPTNLLSTKSASILGTWNVRAMYQSGKAAQIAKEMHKYKIEVMRLDGFQQERRY